MTDVRTRQGRLEAVLDDLQQMRAEWEALGRPSMTQGAGSSLKTHPLVTMIRAAEEIAERMSRSLNAHAGRPVGAQSAPDRVGDRLKSPSKRTLLDL